MEELKCPHCGATLFWSNTTMLGEEEEEEGTRDVYHCCNEECSTVVEVYHYYRD